MKEVSKLLTKEEFIQQYVLNRALAVEGTLDGLGSAQNAALIFERIRELSV